MRDDTAIVDDQKSKLVRTPSARFVLMWVILIFLLWALVSGQSVRFYASVLFMFYALVHSMWISVLLVGVFQTILLIPLRVINLYKSNNVNEFVKTVEEAKEEEEQRFLVQKSVKSGRQVALFYIVNFFLLLVSFASLGRMYLMDFYTKPLNPEMLYEFVPYPNYPLRGRIFSIPYPWFTETVDLGWKGVLWAWGLIMLAQVLIYVIRDLAKSTKQAKISDSNTKKAFGAVSKYTTGYTILMLLGSYLLLRHFPVEWQIFYFRGDIAYPNPTLNFITAMVAFFTLIWLNMGKIRKKAELAREAGIEEKVIERTQTEMFKDTVKVSALVATGAFFITNQIPCAFELSLFTLELIALLSPWTLDKIIMKGLKKPEVVPKTTTEPETETIKHETKVPEEVIKPEETPEEVKEPEIPLEKPPVVGEIKF